MAHEDTISRPILDRLLYCHLRIFSEGRSPYYGARGDYCLKCMTDLQQLKQGWFVSAVKHLYELLRFDSTNTFDSSEKGFISLLVSKHNLISTLFKSLSTCQSNFWNKTQEHVTIDTLVDGRYTYEESIKSHLDLLSFLLEKGNIYLILTRSEELWDILITNDNPNSFIRELGFNWFITCIDYLNRATQIALFDKRVIKLNLDDLSPEGKDIN